MATAVMELYPGTKVSIGPPIENGFYYDFEFPEGVKVTDEDLARIEERMREHVAADEPFERTDVDPGEAQQRFAAEDQDYKVELIRDLVAERGRARPCRCTGTAPSPTSAAARTRPRPAASRRSSCCRSRAPTGAATSATRC